MRVTRKKALVIAEAACRAWDRANAYRYLGYRTITLPEDFATTDWPYDVAMSNDGHLLISKREPWPIGVPYHHNTSGKTWLT